MVRSVALVLSAALLVSCAALAGIGDAPSETDVTDASVEAAVDSGDAGIRPDAAPDVAPIPMTAGIAVHCNGVLLAKYPCANKRWEYDVASCVAGTSGRKVVLENTGMLPVAFIARSAWLTTTSYVPNQATDMLDGETVGVIAAGGTADISRAYAGGIFALVGSIRPFDLATLTAPKNDEGKTATTQMMLGTFATNGVMDVAELTTSSVNRCVDRPIVFAKK